MNETELKKLLLRLMEIRNGCTNDNYTRHLLNTLIAELSDVIFKES